MNSFANMLLQKFPEGYSVWIYNSKKYGVTKTFFNNKKSIKFYGESLDNEDCISFNYYETATESQLRPCEMSKEKVLRFMNESQATD